ncbi:His-Xaa-Ser system radical SAM maturase HxsC [Polyangium mundeleinium]|uniref:His-Xaa-Ser system radical SAM maturase HxsC n=1 Tax=Polyangium mundeleinium TaxID=2995306 RepID=A0ABT5EG71_9BACT|nr:His-Xaa-Ser system radical SAM maturase HxsC [Polyangium mundeleinium]MDC0740810.1 His-Xaa-Ser system radical SAM maturase HxsC [Polyangium mundeleinium]
MLVKLSARGLRALSETSRRPFVARISENPALPEAYRSSDLLLLSEEASELPPGFRGYLLRQPRPSDRKDTYHLGVDHDYLREGDVVRIDPVRGTVSALYRANSRSNTFLVTERCDNFCVMCSQPPKDHDDGWLVDDIERAIPLISPEASEIGVTGGEPALLGERLVRLLVLLREHLPRTSVHVLSNGRRFADASFARAVGDVRHPDLMIGIPLYSDLAEEHDYVVQAEGAFDQTVRGILNLKRRRVRVELRFVIHRETVERMAEFARFVARNLTFLDHVALMGLEHVGFAKTNLEALWIDPLDYQGPLREAVLTLERAGMATSIYNHQLCVLDPTLHRFARKSISDWKNVYVEICQTCRRKEECGGFFTSSAVKRSRGISPYG